MLNLLLLRVLAPDLKPAGTQHSGEGLSLARTSRMHPGHRAACSFHVSCRNSVH